MGMIYYIQFMETIKRKAGRPTGTFKNPVRKTHPLHNTWSGMRQRCNNPKSHVWKYYGGRGIKVCDRWNGKDGFLNFYSDMVVGWKKGLTIDRHPNGAGNYEPGNVRWATRKEQCRNRRSSHVVTAFGTTATIAEWAEKTGKKAKLISQRIGLGWEPERALTAKSRRNDGYHLLEAGKEFEVARRLIFRLISPAVYDCPDILNGEPL